MKKILSLLVVLTMVISLFTTVVYANEDAAFTQDFEGTLVKDSTGSGPLIDGTFARHYANAGSQGSAYISSEKSVSGTKSIKSAANGNATSASLQFGCKIYLDNSTFVDGKQYKIIAKLFYDTTDTSGDTKSVSVIALKGYSYTSLSSNKPSIETGKWVDINSPTFTYNSTTYPDGIHFRVDTTKTGTLNESTSKYETSDCMYIDDVSVVEVEPEKSYFDKSKTITFDDDFELRRGVEYFTNATTLPTISSDFALSGTKSMKVLLSGSYDRLAINGFFDKSDLEKTYNIKMMIYTTDVSSDGLRIGIKGDDKTGNGSNSFISTSKWFSDVKPNQWNEISFSTSIQNCTENSSTYLGDLLFIDHREKSTGIKTLYIDDISITETEAIVSAGAYFENLYKKSGTDFEDLTINNTLNKNVAWSTGGEFAGQVYIINTDNHTPNGTNCVEIGPRTKNTYDRAKFLNLFKDCTVGDTFKISAYVKTRGNNSENAAFRFGIMSNEKTESFYYVPFTATNTEWTKVELYAIIDTDTTDGKNLMDELYIDQYQQSETVCEFILIDDIEITPVTTNKFVRFYGNSSPTKDGITIAASINADNVAASESTPTILTVVYDENGTVIAVNNMEYVSGTNKYIAYFKGNVDKFTQGTTAKAFVWDLDNLIPLKTAPAFSASVE